MVEVHEMRKRFGKSDALEGVSFSFDTGCLAILGPNGAGKTTLIRCLAGLIKPDSGSIAITIDGHGQTTAHLPAGSFGYLPQRFDFFKELTVAEALRYLGSLGGIERRDAASEINRVLASVNLTDKAATRIKSLSGGMLRRLGIAQTLLGSPQTLLYDEPTTGLDPEERARFKALLMSLKGSHRVLLSTHIVDDVQQVCDTVLVMNHGRVIFSGSPDALKERARCRVRVSDTLEVDSDQAGDGVFSGSVERHGALQHRSVCRERVGDVTVEPTLDEGYLCVIHGFDDPGD